AYPVHWRLVSVLERRFHMSAVKSLIAMGFAVLMGAAGCGGNELGDELGVSSQEVRIAAPVCRDPSDVSGPYLWGIYLRDAQTFEPLADPLSGRVNATYGGSDPSGLYRVDYLLDGAVVYTHVNDS